MPFGGNPVGTDGEIEDPLDDKRYVVSFVGEGGKEQETTIHIGQKIFFEKTIINGISER